MIYSPFLIISLPLIFFCIMAFLTYEVANNFYDKTFTLFSLLVLITLVMEFLLRHLKINITLKASSFLKNKYENKLALYFGFTLIIFCAADLIVRGPLLFTDPSSYDILSPTETQIRRIVVMCWTLIPISFLCVENKIIKYLFFITGILLPIIIVDRNCFLNSVYASFVIFCIMSKEKMKDQPSSKYLKKIAIFLTLTLASSLMIFSYVGEKRTSIQGIYRSSQKAQPLKDKYEKLRNIRIEDLQRLQFKPFLQNAPSPLTWLLVYSSVGVFNFAAIHNIDYRDSDYLNYQLFRIFHPSMHNIDRKDLTPRPLPYPPLSACTEFLSFTLYGGAVAVVCSFLAIGVFYFINLILLSKFPSSIFLLLGFLKLSYYSITLGFGSQLFRTSSIYFFILMFLLSIVPHMRMFRVILDFLPLKKI